MSEVSDQLTDQELRRRFGVGDDKQNSGAGPGRQHVSSSPTDSENDLRPGSDTADSDHVRKNIIDFPTRLLAQVLIEFAK